MTILEQIVTDKRVHARREVGKLAAQAACSRAATAARDGLVSGPYLAVYATGRLVEVHLPGLQPMGPIPKRGDIDGMSEDSARRLKIKLNSIRRDAPLPIHLALTFPEEIIVTPAEAKQCRKAFEKRQIERHEKFCDLWRIEAHPEMSKRLGRVHPHFHLMVWGAWFDLAQLSSDWTSTVWNVLEIDPCLMDDEGRFVREKHEAAGTYAERMRNWGGVLYCSKNYIAKREEYPLGKAGRVWGWCQGDLLPIAEAEKVSLTPSEAVAVVEALREWQEECGMQTENLVRSIFCDRPLEMMERLLRRRADRFPREDDSAFRRRVTEWRPPRRDEMEVA